MRASDAEFPIVLKADGCAPVLHTWIMHGLASFRKIQLILLAFKGFFSPCYYLAAILFEGNELTTSLTLLVNLGDS